MKTNLRQILTTLLIIGVVFLGLHYSLQSYTVSGSSMEPSFINGEWLLVDKLSYRFGSPSRGDVIIFNPPNGENTPYIKRIIGLPGEHVEIEDGRIYISNDEGDYELVEATDLPDIPHSFAGFWDIPEDNYFVLGDNRPASGDSRYFGPVPKENIIGRVWIRYWPPSEWGLSPDYSTSLDSNQISC